MMPALERLQPIGKLFASSEKKSKVKRCLFGPPDSDSIRKDLDEILQQEKMRTEHKWNFDIESESPLEGRYEWEIAQANCDEEDSIPEFYRRDVHRPTKKHFSRISGLNNKKSVSDCSEGNVRLLNFRSLDSDSDSEGQSSTVVPRKQSKISDFLQQRKRKLSQPESVSRPFKAIRF